MSAIICCVVSALPALGERNVERREQLLEANDRACAEFRDSLQRIIAEEQRRQH